ncbi:hypothetical protein PSAC2689_120145 [Paraburkholderia sacchari]
MRRMEPFLLDCREMLVHRFWTNVNAVFAMVAPHMHLTRTQSRFEEHLKRNILVRASRFVGTKIGGIDAPRRLQFSRAVKKVVA